MVNVRFQFCLAAESIGQDGTILSDASSVNQVVRKQGRMSSHLITKEAYQKQKVLTEIIHP